MLSDIFAVFKREIDNHGLRLLSVTVPKIFTLSGEDLNDLLISLTLVNWKNLRRQNLQSLPKVHQIDLLRIHRMLTIWHTQRWDADVPL